MNLTTIRIMAAFMVLASAWDSIRRESLFAGADSVAVVSAADSVAGAANLTPRT
jgi:hypothetical protein